MLTQNSARAQRPAALPHGGHSRPDLPICLGPAEILRRVWQGADLGPLTQALVRAAELGAPGAALDLATLLMTQGGDLAAEGLTMQRSAYQLAPSVVIRPGADFTVLALVTDGDFMANTPIDFLLAGQDVTLILHHVDAATDRLDDLPPHDVAFLAVAESPANQAVLARLQPLMAGLTGPVMNRDPARIADLGRAEVARRLQGIPGLLVPPVVEMTAADLARQAIAAPVLLRPLGSHAGFGLARIESADEAREWLAETGAARLTLTPYVDYRDTRGLFAKYRIALIDGQAHAGHMAISRHWMVHYLNAEMTEHASRRAEEAVWMANFPRFAARHAAAFEAIAERLGLDYLGLDCAEMPDGRLVLFEADVAMILHDLDDAGLFPYKKPAMRRLFAEFETALRAHAMAGRDV